MSFLRNIWKANSKHKKLSEELALQNAKDLENEIELLENEDVVTFKLKYLGSTVVEKIMGENISVEAVKNILKVAKASRKKLQRVNVAVSLKGIAVTDLQGNDLFKISIYRISNCSTDATHRQVFSFISTDQNETMECHAFLCSKRKMAETVTLAVAHAFSTAYEAWKVLPPEKKIEATPVIRNDELCNSMNNMKQTQKVILNNIKNEENGENVKHTEEKLIDFDSEPENTRNFRQHCQNNINEWVCFDDDFVNISIDRNRNRNIDLIFS